MPCCCTRILNLCSVAVCGSIEFDVLATAPSESGVENIYTIVLDFMGIQITISELQVPGVPVSFVVSMLNENYQYTGKIYDAEGNNVTIEKDGVEYDCIKFKTVMNVTSY
jgi:hypothetical protein